VSDKYQLVLRCKSCKHKYKRVVTVDEGENVADVPDPPCPKCQQKAKRTDAYETASAPIAHNGMEGIIGNGKAPGIVGNNNTVRAIDKTAEIVMQDYGLSNLKDRVYQGESLVPPLPPAMQKSADNFFGSSTNRFGNKMVQKRLDAAVRRTLTGGNRINSVDVKSLLPDSRVALRRVQ
jgi:hypothetical protein